MAQKNKRPNKNDYDSTTGAGSVKRRKCKLSLAPANIVPSPAQGPCEEEESVASGSHSTISWTPRPLSDIKISSIYNRSATEAPAELFRKDLISAMKLPDNEPLNSTEYLIITDQWKQEWERGVQVPVNPDSLPEPVVSISVNVTNSKTNSEFKL